MSNIKIKHYLYWQNSAGHIEILQLYGELTADWQSNLSSLQAQKGQLDPTENKDCN